MIRHSEEKFEIIVNTSEGEGTVEDVLSTIPEWFESVLIRLKSLYQNETGNGTIGDGHGTQ